MSALKVRTAWNAIYAKIGMRSADEKEQAGVRLAVYVYGVLNGTSSVGAYSGTVTTANGRTFQAAVIPQVVGVNDIRRFFRGNMLESYTSLKSSKVMERNPAFVASKARFGATAETAFATADWMKDCPEFTPAEKNVHEASFNFSIEKARRSRGGKSLDEVKREDNEDNLSAQGPLSGGHMGHEVPF